MWAWTYHQDQRKASWPRGAQPPEHHRHYQHDMSVVQHTGSVLARTNMLPSSVLWLASRWPVCLPTSFGHKTVPNSRRRTKHSWM